MLKKNLFTASDKAILLVAFGTSVARAKKSYENIDRLVKKEFKTIPVYWAYTSSLIRRKLAGQGIKIDSLSESLSKLKKNGVKELVLQSLHITQGINYEEMIKTVETFKNRFNKIKIGGPMLTSIPDLKKFSKALEKMIPPERTKDDAVVLMGHGNHHGIGDQVFTAAANELNKKDKKIFVGTIKSKPNFEEMHKALKKSGTKKAFLMAMMLVAGDHVLKELDSWKNILEKDGIKCVPVLKGLGESDNMVDIFVDHLKKAIKIRA